MKTKEILTFVVLIIIIISIICLIQAYKPNGDETEQTMQCIADKSILIVSRTCGHCANQKKILGEHLDKFSIIYFEENPKIMQQYNIMGVPTWIINEQAYSGVKSITKLKEISEC